MAVCFHWYGFQDYKDVEGISKSPIVEISKGSILLRIEWDTQFVKELASHPSQTGTSYGLIMIPRGISATQITTMRQATNLGGYILDTASGPP
jgi:hypothetical protein